MTQNRRPLIAGNWKMNGLAASLGELAEIIKGCQEVVSRADILICPPTTLLERATRLAANSAVHIGAQDCHPAGSGAFTGDISAGMIADCGAGFVLVGHSERRVQHGESDALVATKARAAQSAGLVAVICIGETQAERQAGETLSVLERQLRQSVPDVSTATDTVIAYEPVWAIGTGLTPTIDDIAEAHAFMRGQLRSRFGVQGEAMRILYGGSVKPSNAAELMAIGDVDGALIGGASLKATDFLTIFSVYRAD